MDIAIGLPSTIPGVTGDEITEWARRAEARGFSALSTIDRIAYPNLEPLIALAAAAAVTQRIKLATTILIAPYRKNNALLAKQAASVQKLSGGRLMLGVAVGGREADYEVSGADFHTRGNAMDELLPEIKEIWSHSNEASGQSTAIGPDVSENPPKLILGGGADVVYKRAAKYGDGYALGGGTPEMFTSAKEGVEAAWEAEGRDDAPYLGALAYFSLGERAEENARTNLGDYYHWLGEIAEMIVGSAAKDAGTAKGYVQAFADAGCQELFFFPASSDPEQIDMLADAVL